MKKQIENIFTKSKPEKEIKCPNPKIPIIVDTREKQSLISANLEERKANFKLEKLDIGDYLIEDTIIERKTFSDFLGSIINKRLPNQLKEMKKYPNQILLLEGFYYNYKDFNIHENAIRGMLLSVALDFKIPIIYTEDEEDTANFLVLTAKKYSKPIPNLGTRPTKTLKNLEEEKQFILEGFPGVGPVAAQSLMENFKNLKEVFNAEKEELEKILTFDEKKIDKFLGLLRD